MLSMSEDDDPDEGVLPLMPELPEVSLPVPEPLLPAEPELPDVLSLLGLSTVVVVVVTVLPEPPDEPETLLPGEVLAPDDEVPDADGSVVMVVVVLCPKLAAAVPINDRKMAIGNFFMLSLLTYWSGK